MSTVSQGASGSTAYTGLRPTLGQPAVGGNYPAPQRIPPEQPVSHEIRRLIVRPFVDVFGLRTNKLCDDSSVPSKHSGRSMRYDPVPPANYSPNRFEGVVREKGRI